MYKEIKGVKKEDYIKKIIYKKTQLKQMKRNTKFKQTHLGSIIKWNYYSNKLKQKTT